MAIYGPSAFLAIDTDHSKGGGPVAESGVAAYACNDQVDRQAKFLKRARPEIGFSDGQFA